MIPQTASTQTFTRYLVALSRTRYGDDEPPVYDPPADEGVVVAGCKKCPIELMAAGVDATADKVAQAARTVPAGPVKCLLVVAFHSDEAANRWATAEGPKFDAIYRLPQH